MAVTSHRTQGQTWIRLSTDRYSAWTLQKTTLFSGHYLHNRSTLDKVFWVISLYFNIRNTLPKSGTFLLAHPVYIYIVCSSGGSTHCTCQLTVLSMSVLECGVKLRPCYVSAGHSCVMYSAWNPKDNYDMSGSFFVVQFKGFMSLTSLFDVKYRY